MDHPPDIHEPVQQPDLHGIEILQAPSAHLLPVPSCQVGIVHGRGPGSQCPYFLAGQTNPERAVVVVEDMERPIHQVHREKSGLRHCKQNQQGKDHSQQDDAGCAYGNGSFLVSGQDKTTNL